MRRLFSPGLWLAAAAALGVGSCVSATHANLLYVSWAGDLVLAGALALFAVTALAGAAYLHVHQERRP